MTGSSRSPSVTVLLTLKGRHDYTKRWLSWMDYQACTLPIIIADGSVEDTIEKHLASHRYRNLHLKYMRFPPDVTLEDWYNKLASASSMVETAYVIHADNDDFILLGPLERAVDELAQSSAVCLSRPQYRVRINPKAKEIENHLIPKQGGILVTRTPCGKDLGALQDDQAARRLEVAIQSFPTAYIWYGIHRTRNAARIHANVANLKFSQAMFQEWYLLYSTAIAGKSVISSSFPYLARQEQTSQAASLLYETERLDRIFLYRGWSTNLERLMQQLYTEFAQATHGMDQETFNRLFREWFSIHLLRFNDGRLLRMRLSNYKILVSIGSRVLGWLKGKSPLLFKFCSIESFSDVTLNHLNAFLRQYEPEPSN